MLILGSFPSVASLAAQQYYGHPQNQFWRILGAILELPLAGADYALKCQAVGDAGIAILDVYDGCQRRGSLDSAIRDARQNDFRRLKKLAPQLCRVCFNGKTAARCAPQLAALGYQTRILPSTSPALTVDFATKLQAWREALVVSA